MLTSSDPWLRGIVEESFGDDVQRDVLIAPGVPLIESERDRAVRVARGVLRKPQMGGESHLLARALLRALGLSERG